MVVFVRSTKIDVQHLFLRKLEKNMNNSQNMFRMIKM